NLIGNGIKFTPKGEVAVAVTELRATEKTVILKFSVRDTGIGIPLESQPRLFEAFVQADGSTTRRFGGTGLGLAISRQLVDLMHGEMGFESTPGQGSSFWFTIPLEKQPFENHATAPTRQNLKILVAEDNVVNQKIALRQLQKLGYSADAVANGLEVLSATKKTHYDVILMDCQMPEHDGYETTRIIRSEESKAPTPLRPIRIIAMTANALAGDRE